jgi:hypothetical protein
MVHAISTLIFGCYGPIAATISLPHNVCGVRASDNVIKMN